MIFHLYLCAPQKLTKGSVARHNYDFKIYPRKYMATKHTFLMVEKTNVKNLKRNLYIWRLLVIENILIYNKKLGYLRDVFRPLSLFEMRFG